MSLLQWKSEYAIGIEAVDHEHREMIDLINGLHDSLSEPETDITVAEFLGEIYAKIAAHFALEERVMRERGYDEFADHKGDHERLLDDIREIMDDYELRGAFDADTLAERLSDWFGTHFSTKDARLHKHLG